MCYLTFNISVVNIDLHVNTGMFVGYVFDNVATDATRTEGSVWLFATSCVILLEYWQLQWRNGNHNRSKVITSHNCFSLAWFTVHDELNNSYRFLIINFYAFYFTT